MANGLMIHTRTRGDVSGGTLNRGTYGHWTVVSLVIDLQNSPKEPHFLTHDKYFGETEIGSTVNAARRAEMLEISSGKLTEPSVGFGGASFKPII